MLSQTYLQDAKFAEAAAKVDPDNRLLWRHNPTRLEAEALRDAMPTVNSSVSLPAKKLDRK